MKNKFFDLMEEYTGVDYLDGMTSEYAEALLKVWIDYPNTQTYNIIDYEFLFFLENQFKNNPQITELIKKLKIIISDNYYKRMQLRKRLIKQDDFEWEKK